MAFRFKLVFSAMTLLSPDIRGIRHYFSRSLSDASETVWHTRLKYSLVRFLLKPIALKWCKGIWAGDRSLRQKWNLNPHGQTLEQRDSCLFSWYCRWGVFVSRGTVERSKQFLYAWRKQRCLYNGCYWQVLGEIRNGDYLDLLKSYNQDRKSVV